jgi:hypothetical protein
MDLTQTSTPVDPAAGPASSDAMNSAELGRARRRLPRRPSVRRGLLDRVTVSTVIGLVAALLVFVLTAVLLRDRREIVTVVLEAQSAHALRGWSARR